MIHLRRITLLLTLMFWQGGFMFYGAVVVPVGTDVLGSHRTQGFVTRKVTNYLNGAGAVYLAVWWWDIYSDRVSRGRRVRWVMGALLAAALGVQLWMHHSLDELLDVETFGILDRHQFRLLHQWYLIVSTLQWAAAMSLLYLTLRSWRDSETSPPPFQHHQP